jgi:hypothetical protein
MVTAHLIPGEQTMSSIKAEPKPSYYELNEEKLEKATGGVVVTKRMDSASSKLWTNSVSVSAPTDPC